MFLVFLLSALPFLVAADRPVVVHLFEWTWDDIAEECERFLSVNGYSGVQVSPVAENVIIKNPMRPWYERYQPMSYNMDTRSGNEKQFTNMVARCNAVNVRIYVDVLLNHMAGCNSPAVGTGGSTAYPCNRKKDFPAVPYSNENFHQTCSINNYQNATEVRDCELDGLHDLDQSQEYVREMLLKFLNHLISLGVAGFRIDAAKHMWPSDLAAIYSRIDNLSVVKGFPPNEKPLIYQEVIDMGGEAIHATDYTGIGLVTDFKYGKELSRAFKGNNALKWLHNFGTEWGLLPSENSIVFIDNHDNQRNSGGGGDILTYKTPREYKMAVGMMLAWPFGKTGRVMSSFSFNHKDDGPPHDSDYNILPVQVNRDLTCGNGWVCEHRWRQIYNMVAFNNIVDGENVTQWWDNQNNQISFCRGNKGFIAFNLDSNDLRENLMTCLPAGTYCDIVSGHAQNGKCSGKTVVVDQNGRADIFIATEEYDGFLALHIGQKLPS